MKKSKLFTPTILVVLLSLCIIAFAAIAETAPPDILSFTYETDRMFLSRRYMPTITFEPDGEYALKWTSSDPKVARVYANGIVETRKIGSAVITATAENGVHFSRAIIIISNTVTSLKLNASKTIKLVKGETVTIGISIEPLELMKIAPIYIRSSKKNVAAIIERGGGSEERGFTIEALKIGKSVITVKSGKAKAKLIIKVVNQ